MTTELWMLVAATAVFIVAILAQVSHIVLAYSIASAASNRDDLELSPVGERLQSSVRNNVEAMVVFIPLTLAISLNGAAIDQGVIAWGTSAQSALGAQLFVASRLVYLPVYAAGIPYLRTAVWMVGFVGLILMGLSLF